jgi:preprotein translocase subunit YajC
MTFFVTDAQAAETATTTTSATTATGQAGTPVPYELSAEKMMMDNLFVLALLFFIFYFLLIRPQQRRLRRHQDLMKSLQKNQKVITSGGIIGTIQKFEGDDVVVIEIAANVKVRVARSAISEVMEKTAGLGETANDN